MFKLIRKYRKHINPPYTFHPKEVYTIIFTLLLLAIVPLTVIASLQVRDIRPSAKLSSNQISNLSMGTLEKYTYDLIKAESSLIGAQSKNSKSQKLINEKIVDLVKKREVALIKMLDTNPDQAVRSIFDQKLLSSFPKNVRKLVEEHGVFEGQVLVLQAIRPDRSEYSQTYIKDGSKLYKLVSLEGDPSYFAGKQVKIKGVRIGKNLVVNDTESIVSVGESTKVLPATNVKKILVVQFNWSDNSNQSFTHDQIRQQIFTNPDSVNAYYRENTFNFTRLEGRDRVDGDIIGPYTIPYSRPTSSSDCEYSDVSNYGDLALNLATNSGKNVTGYNNIIYFFPYSPGCNWGGLGLVAGDRVWINGLSSNESFNHILAHELGHNFALGHAVNYQCVDGSGRKVAISNNCTFGGSDPFGGAEGANLTHTSNYHKSVLGAFSPVNLRTVTSSGDFTLFPIEQASNGLQLIRIPRGVDPVDGLQKYYYIEYRRPFGFDNFSTSDPVVNGVSIRISADYYSIGYPVVQTALIDTVPGTNTYNDSALKTGRAFNDPIKNITVRTISTDSQKAVVEIIFGTPPCVRSAPTIEITPVSQWGLRTQTLAYQLDIQNHDSSACPASTFNISSSLPSGLTQNPAVSSESINAGSSLTKTINLTASSSIADGYYSFTESVVYASSGQSSSSQANFNVYSGVPSKPGNFVVKQNSTSSLRLTWTIPPDLGLGGYWIFRGKNGEWPPPFIASLPPTQTSYTDSGLICGNNYYYIIYSFDVYGNQGGGEWSPDTTLYCDSDNDGYHDGIETYLGTNKNQRCSITRAINDEPIDAYPPDFNDDQYVNLSDVILMGPSYNKSSGQEGFNKRFDLNQDGVVSLADVTSIGNYYNKPCQ